MTAIERRIQKIEGLRPKYATIEDVLAAIKLGKKPELPLSPEMVRTLSSLATETP